ncbi:MAG: methyltransferase [Elusimicrobia bacterium RIFOXYA2_FULL_58_8]|nr:MAG: methyltransferase [Elusimicrobia bacterium RIFOXYA12_FULL_57_11]OGS15453.1 MAG: methyltransferase [Elusimicrobia bacterium RIFOXYA2_FULL_58_8]
MALPEDKYTSNDYLNHNPSWDMGDSPWKAAAVAGFLKEEGLAPKTICEIGCGAGGVLLELSEKLPGAEFCGYEIAPAAARFWEKTKRNNVKFVLGDFIELNKVRYDLVLLLDVIEHIGDPFTFLNGLHGAAEQYVFHIPLDLSALSVARETPLLNVRHKVGHINYFTKNLALELLKESGFDVITWRYTGAAFNSPQSTWKTKLAAIPRFIAYSLSKDWGARLMGGETLLVLARSAEKTPVKFSL